MSHGRMKESREKVRTLLLFTKKKEVYKVKSYKKNLYTK
jgi:hypothetical protein